MVTREHPCLHQDHPCSFQQSVIDHVGLPILNLCLPQFLVRFAIFLAQGHQAKGRICPQPCQALIWSCPCSAELPC